jgi:hypothetical protein
MNEVVWSVNILLGIGLLSVIWVLYYILTLDSHEETNSSISNHNTTSDERGGVQ